MNGDEILLDEKKIDDKKYTKEKGRKRRNKLEKLTLAAAVGETNTSYLRDTEIEAHLDPEQARSIQR